MLPARINQITAAAVALYPAEQRRDFEPMVKEIRLKFRDPQGLYRQLRSYFVKHYDAAHMRTFLALERTPVYRTMHRQEDAAELPEAQAARRRFENNLKADPPALKRMQAVESLDDARNATASQVKLAKTIATAMAAAVGTQIPPGLEPQGEEFASKIRPILAGDVQRKYLFTYRNADDLDMDDYLAAVQQKDVTWFDRTLQAAILAATTDRATRAGDAVKEAAEKEKEKAGQATN